MIIREDLIDSFMRIRGLIVFFLCLAGSMAQVPSPGDGRLRFTGSWWLAANPGERDGFVNGVADCMTWEAGKRGYSATPEQLSGKITRFYEGNPATQKLLVIDVWQRVAEKEISAPAPKSGDTWSNPHWYLNGAWWGQLATTEQTGFLRGYLWCMRTQVEKPHASYSKPVDSYRQKISAFFEAHPGMSKEAIAKTLARYQDAQ